MIVFVISCGHFICVTQTCLRILWIFTVQYCVCVCVCLCVSNSDCIYVGLLVLRRLTISTINAIDFLFH